MGNALDAGTHGASQGVFLVLNIVASLIAITSFVTMLDVIINWFGVLVGIEELTFQVKLCKSEFVRIFVIQYFIYLVSNDITNIHLVARGQNIHSTRLGNWD